ncbi:hypothetical protein ACFL5Z_14130 [Planctomycetota bacterium]
MATLIRKGWTDWSGGSMLLGMVPANSSESGTVRPPLRGKLRAAGAIDYGKILNPESQTFYSGIGAEAPVLVILAAGKGTRFGRDPKYESVSYFHL